MKIKLRRSKERGHADHGWLDSYHTFSFADYYDPAHMGFRSLRVINQDRIAPGGGFPTHPHRDMEIFSYLVEGELQHQDSLGNGRVLKPGQIQMMCAGKGVLHSEFNPSDSEISHLLQIWIQPDQRGLVPSYTEWHPDPAKDQESKVLVISREGRENSASIRRDFATDPPRPLRPSWATGTRARHRDNLAEAVNGARRPRHDRQRPIAGGPRTEWHEMCFISLVKP